MGKEVLQAAALAALDGVGDERLGQWEEYTGFGYHIRRRCTSVEARGVGQVRDIRGTTEQTRRAATVQKYLPPHLRGYKE